RSADPVRPDCGHCLSSHSSSRLCGTRRRLRGPLVLLDDLCCFSVLVVCPPHLAISAFASSPPSPQGVPQRHSQARDRGRLRRHGSETRTSLYRRRPAPKLCQTPRPRHLPPSPDHLSCDLARRVVNLSNRRKPGQAQHLRLSRARLAQLSAFLVLRPDQRTQAPL